jgi:hypothetical protein
VPCGDVKGTGDIGVVNKVGKVRVDRDAISLRS